MQIENFVTINCEFSLSRLKMNDGINVSLFHLDLGKKIVDKRLELLYFLLHDLLSSQKLALCPPVLPNGSNFCLNQPRLRHTNRERWGSPDLRMRIMP